MLQIHNDIPKLSEINDFSEFRLFIDSEYSLFKGEFLNGLDFIYCYNLERTSKSLFDIWKVYEWTPKVYEYFVLLRDCGFIWHKSILYRNDHYISDLSFNSKINEIRDLINSTRAVLFDTFNDKRTSVSQNYSDSLFEKWQHQTNPVPTYLNQIEQIVNQVERLTDENKKLLKQQEFYTEISTLLFQTNGKIEHELNTFENHILHILTEINKFTDKIDFVAFEKKLIKIQDSLKEFDFNFDLTNEIEDVFRNDFRMSQVIRGRSSTKLLVSDFKFSEKTLSWLETDITPKYKTFEGSIHEMRSVTKITLMNLINFITLKKQEEIEFYNFDPLIDSFNSNYQTIERIKSEFIKLKDTISIQIEKQFKISEIFNLEKPYLFQNEYLDSNYLINKRDVKSKAGNLGAKVEELISIFLSKVKAESSLSDSEKYVRHLKNRKIDLDNQSYTNIFLTKGYIGSSFATGRDIELKHLLTLYQSWKEGYRGSVCLKGNRFCGKTFLGEYFLSKLDTKKVIRIEQNQTILLNGRSYRTSNNLEDTLNFIKKYSDKNQYVIWIDDLELFWDNDYHILHNARVLQKFIDQYNPRFFVMVAMNDIVFEFLNLHTELNLNFQTILDCTAIDSSDLTQAILVRHQATHKKVINKRQVEMTRDELIKKIKSVISLSENNIGDTLNLWCSYFKHLDDYLVLYEDRIHTDIPSLSSKESMMLLTDIYIQKSTNEYRLRKQYGQVFSTNYIDLLKRMINIGIVVREPDNNIKINDHIVNKIGIDLR